MKPKPHGRGRATARARSRAGRTAFAHLSATDGMTSAKSRRRLFSRAGTSSAALSVGLASLSVFAMGGLPYGISALYPVLYSENVLASQCGNEAAVHCASAGSPYKCCDEQMIAFSVVATLSFLPSDALVALYGELVDRQGPRKTYLVGMSLASLGLALISLNTQLQNSFLWYLSFWCLGASGPGIFFSVLFLAEKHPKLQPIISALASATFDGSALCFFLWNLLYFRCRISLASISGAWFLFSLALAAATVAQLPSWGWLKRERQRATAPPGLIRSSSSSSSSSPSGYRNGDAAHSDKAASTNGWNPSDDSTRASAAEGTSNEDGSGVAYSPPEASSVVRPCNEHLAQPLISSASPPGTPADPLSSALRHTYYGSESTVQADAEASRHRGGCYSPIQLGSGLALPGMERNAVLPRTGRPPVSQGEHHSAANLGNDWNGSNAGVGIGGSSSSNRLLPSVFLRADTLLLIGTMIVANMKASYYIISLSDFSQGIFDEHTAQTVDLLFNVGFPLGALVMSPISSLMLRRFRRRPDIYMSIALCGVHVFGICTLLPHALPQMLGAVLFGPTRTMLWSSYFHFLSQPRRYPRALAGRTLGYANLLIAVASDVPPPLLKRWVERDDWIVHGALQVALLGCLAFPYYLWRDRENRQ